MNVVKSYDAIVGKSYYIDPTLETYGKVLRFENGGIYFELESENNGYYITEQDNTIGFHVSKHIEFIEKND
jgi:hypothetical protein